MELNTLLNKAEVKLKGVDNRIAERMRQVIINAHSIGIYIIITQGLRTIAEQDALYAQGRTKPGKRVTNAKGGYSFHNFGLAVDFAVVDKTGTIVYWDTNIDTNKDKQKDWYQVGKLGKEQGLEWGGDWTSLVDIPHFQYTFGLTTAQLRAGRRPAQSAQIPAAKNSNDLSYGDSNAKVKDLQEKLNLIGINVGKADGVFGNDTKNGVILLQQRKGLPKTGVVNEATLKIINELVAAKDVSTSNKPVPPLNKPITEPLTKEEMNMPFNTGSKALNSHAVAAVEKARKMGILSNDTYVIKAKNGTLTHAELTAVICAILSGTVLDK